MKKRKSVNNLSANGKKMVMLEKDPFSELDNYLLHGKKISVGGAQTVVMKKPSVKLYPENTESEKKFGKPIILQKGVEKDIAKKLSKLEVPLPDKPIARKISEIGKLNESQQMKKDENLAVVSDSMIKTMDRKEQGIELESYDIEIDGAVVEVSIVKGELGNSYNVAFPEISMATSILLSEIRNDLISLTTISMKELSDPSSFNIIKGRFMTDARTLLKQRIPSVEKSVEDYLVGKLMQEMMGLGKIEFLVADQTLEEIVIPSAKEPIRVYSKKYGWLETNITIEKEEDIVNYANIIARRVGRQISVLNPLLDAHLITGDRVNAVLYPIDTKGNTITIRKFARDPITIVDLINSKTCDVTLAALIWMAMEYEMNILISGGTGSGKTSFLNAILPFIPPSQRIISIEDTRELMLPEFLYWTPLVTRTPNAEGKGEVSMLDLLINSLRMRPDRIILGEMRKQQEAMVLFEAMHTGHSVYATVHADSAAETVSRLVNPPLSIPFNLLKSVHLNVVMFRDRKKGLRRVFQVAEFEVEKNGAASNVIYRWIPENDKIVKHSESSRFFEEISRHTGMSNKDIDNELKEKAGILNFVIKNNMRSLAEIGKVMNLYYKNREVLTKAVYNNDKKMILGK